MHFFCSHLQNQFFVTQNPPLIFSSDLLATQLSSLPNNSSSTVVNIFYKFVLDNYCFHCFHRAGAVEALINSGRQIDAVNLAFAFELTEQYPPVPLLKSYLQEARKVSSPVRHGNSPHTVQVCYAKHIPIGCLNVCLFRL